MNNYIAYNSEIENGCHPYAKNILPGINRTDPFDFFFFVTTFFYVYLKIQLL